MEHIPGVDVACIYSVIRTLTCAFMCTYHGYMHRLSKPSASLLSTLSSPFLKALADPARQTIICVLVQNGGLDVTSISEYLTQERSVVSRHLKVLNEAGIVEGEKIGRQVIYRLRGENIVQHIEHLLNELKKTMATCCR